MNIVSEQPTIQTQAIQMQFGSFQLREISVQLCLTLKL